MDITALSMAMSQINLGQQVDLAVFNLAKNASEAQTEGLIKMMETSSSSMELSINPHIGGNIDIIV